MQRDELHAAFAAASNELQVLRDKLEAMLPHLILPCDQWAVRHILTDLLWAVENCHVISRHQVGEKLGDDTGYYFASEARAQEFPDYARHRLYPANTTIEELNRSILNRSGP